MSVGELLCRLDPTRKVRDVVGVDNKCELPLIIFQVFQVRAGSPVYLARLNPFARGVVYGAIIVGILIFSQRAVTRFIYQGF